MSDVHLEGFSSDCGRAFVTEVGHPSDIISVIRAKEDVQATLAFTAFRKEQAAKAAAEVQQPPSVTDGAVNDAAEPVSAPSSSTANKRRTGGSKLATRSGRGRKAKA